MTCQGLSVKLNVFCDYTQTAMGTNTVSVNVGHFQILLYINIHIFQHLSPDVIIPFTQQNFCHS